MLAGPEPGTRTRWRRRRASSSTAGPNHPEDHCSLTPLERFELGEEHSLIAQRTYLVLHAPRQGGKTTLLLALRDHLDARGHYHSVCVNVGMAQSAREDVWRGTRVVLGALAGQIRAVLGDDPL